MLYKVLYISLLAPLVGCATLTPMDGSERRKGMIPSANEEVSANIGAPILKAFDYIYKPRYAVESSVIDRVGLGAKIEIFAGQKLMTALFNNTPCFLTTDKVYSEPLMGPTAPICFFDQDKDGIFEYGKYPSGVAYLDYTPSSPIAYSRSDVMSESSDSFSYELILTSANDSEIKLTYREFSGNMARPAFYQDVTFTIEGLPQVIQFRTARIKIKSITNNSINYKILAGF
ncbi:MAG: hypothetical protein VYB93_00430 [Pseudomonadota bacterium]|nr:hypothetical protein [Pseudomonadota bacterium]